MMDDTMKIEKVKQFERDPYLKEAVLSIITETFLEKRDGDYLTKAAQRIALDFLVDAKKNLQKVAKQQTIEPREPKNPGI